MQNLFGCQRRPKKLAIFVLVSPSIHQSSIRGHPIRPSIRQSVNPGSSIRPLRGRQSINPSIRQSYQSPSGDTLQVARWSSNLLHFLPGQARGRRAVTAVSCRGAASPRRGFLLINNNARAVPATTVTRRAALSRSAARGHTIVWTRTPILLSPY